MPGIEPGAAGNFLMSESQCDSWKNQAALFYESQRCYRLHHMGVIFSGKHSGMSTGLAAA